MTSLDIRRRCIRQFPLDMIVGRASMIRDLYERVPLSRAAWKLSLYALGRATVLCLMVCVTACNSLNQTPRTALVRAPGNRFYGKPIPVKIEASKHTEFAALSSLAYDAALEEAAAPNQDAAVTAAAVSSATGNTCDSPDAIVQKSGWTRWASFVSSELEERFEHVHLRVEVWENNRSGIVAVAFGGTTFTDWADWKANLRWFLPFKSDEYSEIVKDFGPAFRGEFLRRKGLSDGAWMNSALLISTGHSLGGGLAQQFAYALPLDEKLPRVHIVYAFDPSPVTGFYSVEKEIREINRKGLYIDRVFERGEILAGIRSFVSLIYPPTAKDASIRAVRYQLFFSWNPIRSHSIKLLSCHLDVSAR